MKLFAVVRTRGEAWNSALELEQQPDWEAHCVYMNALQRDGFIVLGGPLEQTPDVLLIFRAESADEIEQRLDGDPWTASGLLRVSRIAEWDVRLGSITQVGH